jgi:hypothetical protein
MQLNAIRCNAFLSVESIEKRNPRHRDANVRFFSLEGSEFSVKGAPDVGDLRQKPTAS